MLNELIYAKVWVEKEIQSGQQPQKSGRPCAMAKTGLGYRSIMIFQHCKDGKFIPILHPIFVD